MFCSHYFAYILFVAIPKKDMFVYFSLLLDHQLLGCCYATVKQVCAVCQSLTFWCHLVTTCTQKTSHSFFFFFILFFCRQRCSYRLGKQQGLSIGVRSRDKKSLLSFRGRFEGRQRFHSHKAVTRTTAAAYENLKIYPRHTLLCPSPALPPPPPTPSARQQG